MKSIIHKASLFIIVAIIALISCNRDEIFEREQYKAVVALLSDDGFNIFAEELEFSEDGVDGYIAASCGGVKPTTEAIDINIIEDEALLKHYNVSNFDTDADRYAQYLNSSRYDVDSYKITIPAGERNARMHIKLRTEGLSPDTLYLIPFRVETFSAYEFSPRKNTVLYRIYLKNRFASTKDGDGATMYNHRGKRGATNTMMQKKVFPVGRDEVRIMAGIKEFKAEEESISRWSLLIKVEDDGKVIIEPWDKSQFGMKVTQVDGDEDFPNNFTIFDDGYNKYKTFLLRYDYVDPDDGATYQMSEELRVPYNEREDY